MAVRTTKTLTEQINDALRGKIIYWIDQDKTHYGKIINISGDKVVVDQEELPIGLKPDTIGFMPYDHIKIIGIDQAMMGVYETVSLN